MISMREPTLSVGLIKSASVNLELYGDFRIRSVTHNFSGKYSAYWESGKITLTGVDYSQSFDGLILEPRDPSSETFLLKDVTIGINFHWQRQKNFRFHGALKLIVQERDILGINLVPLEQYLTSVISSEMSASSPIELLKAHAIISRSWVIAQLKARKQKKEKSSTEIITDDEIIRWYDRNDHELYEFCSDDHCQRYQGITKKYNDRAFSAVEDTRGVAIVYNNDICDTRYSKCCGGISESFENVWEDKPKKYLSSIIDYKFEPENLDTDLTQEHAAVKWIKGNPSAFCNTKDEKILSQILVDYDRETLNFYRWKVQYSQEELAKLIHKKSGIDFGKIIELIPIRRGYSGRIIKLKIVGSNKELIIGKELEIRRVLSETHLYSSAFYVETKDLNEGIPGTFILHGAGWGHGVGLCQIGAAVMGEKGYMFDEILLHYFKGARIERIYK
ncbi:MAG: SpoIID/LytB domain-containing protein [Melioribacteraceae bacterium]|nr:SpoIID/LytB domain-containing protein [Melioribacteraceae bacterium]